MVVHLLIVVFSVGPSEHGWQGGGALSLSGTGQDTFIPVILLHQSLSDELSSKISKLFGG